MATTEAKTTPDPLSIRITPSGKLYTYVRHALEHLTEHPEQPVELHTRLLLPATATKPLQPIVSTKPTDQSDQPSTSLLPCTTSIPRLISVIEIVKREFLLLKSKEGAGLWQYNQTGTYTQQEVHEWEEQQRRRKVDGAVSKDKGKGRAPLTTGEREKGNDKDAGMTDQPMDTDEPSVQKPMEATTEATARGDQVLRELLSGANHPKMSHAPYMSVVLSTRPLPHLLANKEISYQPVKPLGKKRRRRALTNAERKLKKARSSKKGTDGATGEEEEEEEVEEPEELELGDNGETEEPETLELLESLPKATAKSRK